MVCLGMKGPISVIIILLKTNYVFSSITFQKIWTIEKVQSPKYPEVQVECLLSVRFVERFSFKTSQSVTRDSKTVINSLC